MIQGRGASVDGDYTSFQIRTESLHASPSRTSSSRSSRSAIDATSFGAQTVSESFGRQIANAAIFAIVVSLLLIVALHLRPLPVEVLDRRPRGARARHRHHGRRLRPDRAGGLDGDRGRGPDRARLLDVRHDHRLRPHPRERAADAPRVVPRDRQRLALGGASALARDDASSRCSRSRSLYFFGGDTLKDFAFALLVGIGFGAYSSIFLAAPLVAALKEREPEFARRRDDLGALEGVDSVGGTLAEEADERWRRRRAGRRGRGAGGGRAGAARPAAAAAAAAPRRRRSGSADGSGAPRGLMAEPASSTAGTLETLALAGIGALALAAGAGRRRSPTSSRAGSASIGARCATRSPTCSTAGAARRSGSASRPATPHRGSPPSSASRRASGRGARAPRRSARAPAEAARAGCARRRGRRRTPRSLQSRPWPPAERPPRSLGRLSEIAQVAARHGFGYFLRRNRLGDLALGRRRDRRRERLGPRAAAARDARRARPDVRQVRPAPLDDGRTSSRRTSSSSSGGCRTT